MSWHARAAMLYCIAVLLSAAYSADVPRSAYSAALQITIGLGCVCATLVQDKHHRPALRVLAVAALGIFAINLWPWIQDGAPLAWRVVHEKNSGLAMFNIIFLAALATGELRHPAWWLWCAAFAWLMWFTGSRGGLIGLAAGVVMLTWGRRLANLWPLAFAPLVAAAAWIDDGRLFLTSWRERYWQLAWDMFSARPLTGWGPDTYVAQYMARFPGEDIFTHAHSLYLNTLAEGGLLAFTAMLALTAAVVHELWRRRAGNWASAALAVLAALLAHGLVDTPLNSIIVSLPAMMVIGMGLSDETA